jgi:hypothetical protein
MIATTISSSINVKPFSVRIFIGISCEHGVRKRDQDPHVLHESLSHAPDCFHLWSVQTPIALAFLPNVSASDRLDCRYLSIGFALLSWILAAEPGTDVDLSPSVSARRPRFDPPISDQVVLNNACRQDSPFA